MGTSGLITLAYKKMYRAFGPQGWWPADSPLEVMVGAVLTQNTGWANVEKAISNLKKENALSFKRLHEISLPELSRLIKPSGYYNIKAQRLKNLLNFIVSKHQGSLKKMFSQPDGKLREELLSIKGIGRETADSIMCYAGEKAVFVVDSYTKRIFSRLGICGHEAEYDEIQNMFYKRLDKDHKLFNEYHALIVKLGKEYCRPTPLCAACPLKGIANGKCRKN